MPSLSLPSRRSSRRTRSRSTLPVWSSVIRVRTARSRRWSSARGCVTAGLAVSRQSCTRPTCGMASIPTRRRAASMSRSGPCSPRRPTIGRSWPRAWPCSRACTRRRHGRAEMLVLSRRDVSDLLSLPECVGAIEEAFRLHADGRTYGPGVLGVHVPAGGFHIKAAGLVRGRSYFAAKVNGNFSGNPRERGLPAIQGVIVLADADTGTPLAILDSMEITALRTAATTALAARWLARPGASTMTVIGCGVQGRYHVRALAQTLALERIWLYDIATERA